MSKLTLRITQPTIVHEKNHPVMSGNVSMRHRIFLLFGIGFLISGHGFIDCSVNEGGCAFAHAFSVFLNDGSLLRGNADLYLDKSIIIFFCSLSCELQLSLYRSLV